jgi:glutathione S-transferase
MLTLYIGNKNYSSWSLRAWLLLRVLDIPFEERQLQLFGDAFQREVARVSPAGRVPVLVDDGFAVWDTLAIAEYVAERFPDRGAWPADPRARARARSVCAEMHSGFGAVRNHLPMNIEADLPGALWPAAVRADIARIVGLWEDLLARDGRDGFAAGHGPFLFGRFCAADAFFAPVVSRFVTYHVPVPQASAAYMDAILALPSMREWSAQARAEQTFIPEDEPYRDAR